MGYQKERIIRLVYTCNIVLQNMKRLSKILQSGEEKETHTPHFSTTTTST